MMNYRLDRESTLLLWNLSFSLLGSSIGFVSFLYFVSVGYSLAIGTVAIVLLFTRILLECKTSSISYVLHTRLVALWGVRLVAFLLHREFISWPEWHDKVKEVHKHTNCQMKSYVWTTCGAFYSMMMYPCTNRMSNAIERRKDITKWGAAGRTGLLLQILGLLLETVADYQKGEFKRKNGDKNKWCNVGLWSKFRHPNYLG